jgi:threonyl-tRNA synthetase
MVSSLTQSQKDFSQPDGEQLARMRHTCAHIMAMAVQKLFPGTKVATGPVTENGFYYDFDCPVSITPDDLEKIEAEMQRIIQANLPIIREEVQRAEIRAEIVELNEPYKLEILERIPPEQTITRYFIGSPEIGKPEASLFITDVQPASHYWWDLCAGPHINFTGEIEPDFNLPERFDMEYIAADGSRQRPIMIHRAIFGSLERFFGILIENYAGDFPLWLAPVQVRLLPVSDEVRGYAESVLTDLQKAGLRVEIDNSGERLGKQIRTAELEKIPVVAVVGKKEVENQNLSVRTRQSGDLGVMSLSELVHRLQAAIISKDS